jgi:hypothetical protein
VNVVSRERHLLQLVGALHPPRRFAGRLHRRQQQRDQDANDGNHDEQFHEREIRPVTRKTGPMHQTTPLKMMYARTNTFCLFAVR